MTKKTFKEFNELESFDDLLKDCESIMYKQISKVYRHSGNIDELRQAARLGAWAAYKNFEPERGKWTTFLSKCVLSEVIKVVRKTKAEESIELWELAPDPSQDGQSNLDFNANYEYWENLFEELSTKFERSNNYEKLVDHMNGMPLKDIAAKYGTTKQAISETNRSIKAFLKEKLIRDGVCSKKDFEGRKTALNKDGVICQS